VEDAVNDDPKMDLDAWEPQLPPSDFAERVLAEIRAEAPREANKPSADTTTSAREKSRARRWGTGAGVVGLLALAAALAMRVTGSPDAHGEAIAKDRLEVSIGSRARAVLEPGAQVKWDGDEVVQAHGDVFYRVEPGARFRVHTPAGDVEVKGTCFAVKIRGEGQSSNVEGVDMNKRDVKSGVIGAALSALAFVAVYEGKVAVSHAGERVDLGAGESAQAGARGVSRSGTLGAGEKSFDAKAAANASGDAPLAQANENLVAQVSEYRARLEAIAAQKLELEQTLKNTEQKLASKGDGSAPKSRSDFDLGADDWKELAKDGTIKYMMPCKRPGGWVASPDQLQKLALAPHDGPALQSAYAKSNERLWSTIKPLCGQAIGSVEVAEKVGMSTCIHLVLDLAQAKEKDAANEAMRQVAEIRAGVRPPPGPNEQTSAVTRMFLALTGEMKSFEGDLAQSLGPEEAHRVAYAEGMCMGQSTFGGPGPREPEKK
jgi:ferric-dicitrate binding protein FerR (iron transport regulator)